LKLLQSSFIANCPVTAEHVSRAQYIYGNDVASIKEKTSWIQPRHIISNDIIPVPQFVRDHHNDVTLCVDIFFANGMLAFFHTIARNIQFRTVHDIANRKYKTLLSYYQDVANLYESRNSNLIKLHADMEFECLKTSILPTQLHVVSQGEHVPEVERSVCTMKKGADPLSMVCPTNITQNCS